MTALALIGVDPGFANIGFATLVVGLDCPRVTQFTVFKTEPETKKRKVLATEDNLRRATEIARHMRQLVARTMATATVAGFCAEAMSFPRSSSAAAKMAMTWGILAMLSEATSIPILQASPQRVKTEIAGKKSASKEEVEAAVFNLYPEIGEMRAKIARGSWEHPHDALAVAHVCLSESAVAMARRVL